MTEPIAAEGDPLGEAIAVDGLSDRPLNETSSAAKHSVDTRGLSDRAAGSISSTKVRGGSPSHLQPGNDDAVSTAIGEEEDLVVYDSQAKQLSASPSSEKRSEYARQRSGSTGGSSGLRTSIELVSFGFRDNLLPLSLSRADNDDDSFDDAGLEDIDGPLTGAARGLRNDYGDFEGSKTSHTPRRTRLSSRGRKAWKAREPQRRIGLIDGIALTVGLQVGSGIFSSPGVVTLNAGSIGSSLIVWLFSGILAWSGASSFAELGAAIPQNGGAQAYLNYSFGPLPSYLFSWTAIVALKPGSSAIISIIFGEYVARIIFHAAKSSVDHPHRQGLEGVPEWSVKFVACIIVILVSAINAFSARLGTRTQVTTTVVKLIALVAVPILAIVFATRGNMPEASRRAFSSLGNIFANSSTSPSSYALALYSGLWAFDGWDQASYVGGEMKNVSRDLPLVIHSSMTLVIFFFGVTVVSYFLVLAPSLVERTNTVALDFGSAVFGGSTAGGIVFACLVVFSCFGAINSQVYTSSRLVYAAGKEGYLPTTLGTINKRTATPVAATVFQAVLVLVFILFGSGFSSLVSFYGVCSYTWYFLTVLGLLVLRVKEPNLERPYSTWLPTPVIFATTALFLLVMPIASAPLEATAAFTFMLTGLPAYFVSTGSWRSGGGTISSFLKKCRGRGSSAQTAMSVLGEINHGGNHEDDYVEGDEEEAMEMLQRNSSSEWASRPRQQDISIKGKQRAVDGERESKGDDPHS